MTQDSTLPLLVILSSLVPGVLIFLLPEQRHATRTLLNLAGALTKLIFVGLMLWGVYRGNTYTYHVPFLPGLDLTLQADPLPLFFVTLSAVLWLLTTIYAIGYLEGSPHRSRFFGYFSLSVTATVGIAMAADLLTFLLFYEMLTVTTYPLVVHRGHPAAMRAGNVYLCYTLLAGAVLLAAIAWLYSLTGTLRFADQGFVAQLGSTHRTALVVLFVLLAGGFGTKAALVPLHSWLPRAMIAPAPVSALLHAVAVVKAGAYGLVRLVTDVFGVEFSRDLGVLEPLAVVAAATILYGSLQALRQDDLKKRLAFSTVSQVSYIILGIAVAAPLSTVGGILHLVHQGLMKITLFFCAGILAETLEIHRIHQMKGVGRRMPWTMAAFTIAALGMIGVPPTPGFVTKWYVGLGGLQAGQPWVLAVLALSTILNAAYFLPIVWAAWFGKPNWPDRPAGRPEASLWLLLPTLATAGLIVWAGTLANMRFSPLYWARIIARRDWGIEPRWIQTSLEFQQDPLWLAALGLPLVAALLLLVARRFRPLLLHLAPWSLLPALALSIFAPAGSAHDTSWLLLGVRLGLDESTRVFLFLTASLWLLAGVYADRYLAGAPRRTQFVVFWLLAATGNVGLVLAQDVVSFYLFFALMSYSSYVLIVSDRTEGAFRAGRVYIVLVVLNEALLLSSLWLVAGASSSVYFADLAGAVAAAPARPWIVALVLTGLGIKAGVLVLHVWLPLAHPVAPTPASAVLSGAMIKVGVLGWLRLLPLGHADLPVAGTACVVLGISAAFYAALVGLTQTSAKTVLAYSSVSQMGFLTLAVGLGLWQRAAWPAALVVVLLYALHHALAKGALFLGVGVAQGRPRGWRAPLVAAGLLLPALALAGAPGTSGAAAKGVLAAAAAQAAPLVWRQLIDALLPWAAVATTLLMLRFLDVLWQETRSNPPHARPGLAVPWLVLLAGVALAVPLWPWQRFSVPLAPTLALAPDKFWSGLWPVLAGTALFAAAKTWGAGRGPRIPPGDVLQLIVGLLEQIDRVRRRLALVPDLVRRSVPLPRIAVQRPSRLARREHTAADGGWVGLGLLVILILLFVLLWLP